MSGVLQHRGPDDAGAYLDDGLGLAVRRLSIIDPAGGHQPIASEDGNVVVVCNGEIYDFVELRRSLESAGHRFATSSDVEVIVHLYEEHGTACLEYLRGMFALALWDRRARRLVLARDRLGIKPLVYAMRPEGILFGSEAKAILASGLVPPAMDTGALADFLLFGFVVNPRTIFRGVRSLPPGHLLEVCDARSELRRYWEPNFPARGEPAPELGEDEWAEALRERLDECVRLHVRSDVPVGTLLSPGLDSSSVLSLMPGAVTSFSLGFEAEGFDEFASGQPTLASDPRWTNVHSICRRSDVEHLPVGLWHGENPTTSGLEVSRMVLARAAAEHGYKVVLTGEGADELLGGYRWFQGQRVTQPIARLPAWLRSAMALGSFGERYRPGLASLLKAPAPVGVPRYAAMIRTLSRRAAVTDLLEPDVANELEWPGLQLDPPPPAAFSSWDPFCQLQYVEMRTRLPDLIVSTLDRATMACSVEARVPFLDHTLVELCSRIPPAIKMKRLREKYVLRLAMKGVLPDDIRWRRKQGMRTPIADWLRDPLPEFAEELLSEGALRDVGLFAPRAVESLREQRRAGNGQLDAALWAVLVMQLWHRTFIAQPGWQQAKAG